MSRVVFLIFLLNFTGQLMAQEIGVRFGDMFGNHIAIDGTIPIKEKRIHASISFGDNVGLDLVYDFLVEPMFRSPDLRYYVGIGVSTLFASEYKLGVAGELGLEYGFPRTPLVIGLDYRPAIIVLEKMDFNYAHFGLNARYVFP